MADDWFKLNMDIFGNRKIKHLRRLTNGDSIALFWIALLADIDHFFTLCTELRVSIPETMKYFCTSEQIALYIQKYVQYRKRKVFFGATGKFVDLLPSIVKHGTEKYFVPMSDVHTDEIKNAFGCEKDSAYRSCYVSYCKQ